MSLANPTKRQITNGVLTALLIMVVLIIAPWLLFLAAFAAGVALWGWTLARAWKLDQVDRLTRKIDKLEAELAADDEAHEVNRFAEALDSTLDKILGRDRESEA